MLRFRFLAWLLGLGLVACAEGDPIDAGGAGAGGVGGQGGAASSVTASTVAVASSSASTGAGAGGAGGAGGEGHQGGAGGGPACDYSATNQCSSPEEIQGIDGDQNADVRSASGTTSKWFEIYVAEAVSSAFDYPPLSYTATLTASAAMNWDLFVYTGDASATSCTVSPEKASGSPESISKTWGDNKGTEDGTWLILEVRYVSGDLCGDEASWILTVKGHTG